MFNIKNVLQNPVTSKHHGDYIHTHPHGHHPELHGHAKDKVLTSKLDRWFGNFRFYPYIRPALIGVVHGFAGTATLTLMLITAAIAVPFIYSTKKSLLFNKQNLRMAAGLLSLGFGPFLFYQIGFA